MCGAIEIAARNVPQIFGACHCDMCKRWTGNTFNGVSVAHADLTLTGADAMKVIKSSDWAERAFCGSCGSPIWYRVTEDGPYSKTVSLAIGLLDDWDGMTLGHAFYTDRKTSVHVRPEGCKDYTEAETLAMFAPADEGEI
jgi:hypothetical protein